MHRNGLIFVGALLLVLAIVFCFRMTGTPAAGAEGALVVRVYPVPAVLGSDIRDSLRTIMFATKEGTQPIGHASLTRPGQLLVSAPEAMHASIAKAIDALSTGAGEEAAAPHDASAQSVAFELWIVGVDGAEGTDDPSLASATDALVEAREVMDLGRLFRLQRAVVTGTVDGEEIEVSTEAVRGSVRLSSGVSGVIRAAVRFVLPPDVAGFTRSPATFMSDLTLRERQWQVVALLSGQSGDGSSLVDRLLLVRATRIGSDGSASIDPKQP